MTEFFLASLLWKIIFCFIEKWQWREEHAMKHSLTAGDRTGNASEHMEWAVTIWLLWRCMKLHFWPVGQAQWRLTQDATYCISSHFYGWRLHIWVHHTVLSQLFHCAVRNRGIFISWNNASDCGYDEMIILSLYYFSVWVDQPINLDLTGHLTLLVKVDNAAVSLAPGTQIHSPSLSDVGLAGVGFRSTNQNTDTRKRRGKMSLTLCCS